MRFRTLVLAATLFMFILGIGGQASAFSTPPSENPMTMLNISIDPVTHKLAIQPTTIVAPLATNTLVSNGNPAAGIADFDPAQPYAVLNGTAFSRRFGWNDPNEGIPGSQILDQVRAFYGPGANIWIQSLQQSPGFNTYQATKVPGWSIHYSPSSVLPAVPPSGSGTALWTTTPMPCRSAT